LFVGFEQFHGVQDFPDIGMSIEDVRFRRFAVLNARFIGRRPASLEKALEQGACAGRRADQLPALSAQHPEQKLGRSETDARALFVAPESVRSTPRDRLPIRCESVGLLAPADVAMIALARFIVMAKRADSTLHQCETVFEPVFGAACGD
jgi:hypothetical protein